MSIRDRVDDGRALWQAGRPEGALLVACVAVAAAARHRFPGMKDRDAFISLLRLVRTIPVMEVEFRGRAVAIEALLYQWVRCELAHTATLPIDIGWIGTPGRDDLAIRAGGAPEFRLLLSEGWIGFLLTVAESFAEA